MFRLITRLLLLILMVVTLLGSFLFTAAPVTENATAAQGEGGTSPSEGMYSLGIIAANCQGLPTDFPFQGGGCVPAEGALITVTTDSGNPIGSCRAESETLGALIAGCIVPIPFGSTVVVTEDLSTIRAGYTPTNNPQTVKAPNEPIDGVDGGPIFFNLPVGIGASDRDMMDDESDSARTLTIYATTCPPGFKGGDYFSACHADPAIGTPFRIGIPFFDAFTAPRATDDAGFVSFNLDGLTDLGALRIIAELPTGTEEWELYCTTDGGRVVLGVNYIDYSRLNPHIAIVDLAAQPSDDVSCTWYNIPGGTSSNGDDDTGGHSGPLTPSGPSRGSITGQDSACVPTNHPGDLSTGDVVTIGGGNGMPVGTTMYRGNVARTGEQPGVGPQGVPLPDQSFLSGFPNAESDDRASGCYVVLEETATLVATDGVVYVGGSFRAPGVDAESPAQNPWGLLALNPETGAVGWFTPVFSAGPRASLTAPAVATGAVYMANAIGDVYSFDAATGYKRWRFQADGAVNDSPVVANGVVYVTTSDGILHALDAATGQQRWHLWLGDLPLTAAAVAEDVIYVGSQDGVLYAADIATGEPRWRFETSEQIFAAPAVADGLVYVTTTAGITYAVDVATGRERWHAEMPTDPDAAGTDPSGSVFLASPAVAGGRVYVGGYGYLVAFDAANGEERWRLQTDSSMLSGPSVADGTIYTVSLAGTLYAVDAATGEQHWRFSTRDIGSYGEDGRPAVLSAPAVMEGTVYFVNVHGVLYAVTGSNNP